MDYNDIKQLNTELETAMVNLTSYQSQMYLYKNYYKYSAFRKHRTGDIAPNKALKDNLLKVFADKLMHFTSAEPIIKVPGTPEDRENANMREKIIYAVRRKSGTKLLQKKWAKDTTLRSIAISEVGFDLDARCAYVRRYDPRFVVWKMSNSNETRVDAFWALFPITADEAFKRYGVRPTADFLNHSLLQDNPYFRALDGQNWFMHAIRWDDKTRRAWIGNVVIEEPHNHNLGVLPVDICAPIEEDEAEQIGGFYLEPLVPLQAELNDVLHRRSNIVRRMSAPVVWGRNIVTQGFDDVKKSIENSSGGFVGLSQNGEMGVLQIQETKMLDNHKDDIIQDMMRLSGFSGATFGEPTGANTSGDALGMYFTPTSKLIDDINISWMAFHESINSKILRAYDRFGMTGETFQLTSLSPASTIQSSSGEYVRNNGVSKLQFTREVIAGDYTNVCTPMPVTPKNEIEEKRFWIDASDRGIISRTTAYEKLGIDSPEDELSMLGQEQSDPVLNPEGTQKLLDNSGLLEQTPTAPVLPEATPAAVNGA